MSEERAVVIYGHIRSGNNLLGEVVHRCFYPEVDLSVKRMGRGHWSNAGKDLPNAYGKIFKEAHPFYHEKYRGIYIYRDGRDVALSTWRTKNFLNKDYADSITLSDYLATRLDWMATPGKRIPGGLYEPTIIEHWLMHVDSWEDKPGVLYVRYEELLTNTEMVISDIAGFIGKEPVSTSLPDELVGPFPNEGKIGKWKDFFSGDDLDRFFSIVPRSHWALWNCDT